MIFSHHIFILTPIVENRFRDYLRAERKRKHNYYDHQRPPKKCISSLPHAGKDAAVQVPLPRMDVLDALACRR